MVVWACFFFFFSFTAELEQCLRTVLHAVPRDMKSINRASWFYSSKEFLKILSLTMEPRSPNFFGFCVPSFTIYDIRMLASLR